MSLSSLVGLLAARVGLEIKTVRSELASGLGGKAATSHNHAGADVNSGTVAIARIPTGSSGSTVPFGNDARFSDARTPTAHKTTHATGGGDALTPSDIGAAPTASPTFTGTVTTAALAVAGAATFADTVIKTPQTQSVTTSLAIDASTGDVHHITATGNPTMAAVPTNPTEAQMLLIVVFASGGARTVTLHASIALSTGLTASMVIASGKVGHFGLRYSALDGTGKWTLLAATQSL